ncbi:TPA: YdiL family protein [Escherichia coli]|uniref:YdiL family protein n=1 Tax=Escherichia coli TaxID=562 RepID=UPI001EEBF29B|nr:YdiL family protein [Escherichia coli]HBB7679002.1 YdiL family protein [Escherichia coli]
MNAYELQALRHIFAMTIDECATWIAQTGDSESWRQWENGKCAIPDRVVEQLLAMRQQRKKHLHAIIEKINNRIGNNTMRFFPDLTAFQQVYPDGNFIDWKIYQSVAAELYAHDLERLY